MNTLEFETDFTQPITVQMSSTSPLQSNCWAVKLKRVIDVLLSSGLLLCCLPLMAVLALAIRLDSPGPAIYRSRRIGRNGKPFWCLKLRTMVAGADQLRGKLTAKNHRDGILFKVADDPRITRVGRILRKYSADELPQLWNVLKGEMSLVGPRPALAEEVAQFRYEHLERLTVTPGITGLWQVEARRDPSFQAYIRLDLAYVRNWSPWLDCKILLRTISVVMVGTGQ